jgi:hypothetical protein
LDYFEIAHQLALFVFKTPSESVVYKIRDKLELPLETLKQRRIPVDQLLKSVEPRSKKDPWLDSLTDRNKKIFIIFSDPDRKSAGN